MAATKLSVRIPRSNTPRVNIRPVPKPAPRGKTQPMLGQPPSAAWPQRGPSVGVAR